MFYTQSKEEKVIGNRKHIWKQTSKFSWKAKISEVFQEKSLSGVSCSTFPERHFPERLGPGNH